MRALVLRDYRNLEVQDVPDPVVGPTDVLVEIAATGICGSDLHGYTGENGRRQPGQVMGHETAGRIRALGPGVSAAGGLEVGQAVTVNPVLACGSCGYCAAGQEQSCPDKSVIGVTASITSAFAELLAVPARNVIPLPPGTHLEYGALVEPLAVGYHALLRGGCRPGERVLVLGGGPIGQACLIAAGRLGGDRVAVTEPVAHRRALITDLGAHAVDPTTEVDVSAEVARALGGAPSLVVDAVGSTESLRAALTCAPPGSTVVLVGMGSPQLTFAGYDVSTAERAIVGSFCYSARDFQETATWVGTTDVPLGRLVEGRIGLDDAPAMFSELANGREHASKVLVLLNGLGRAG
jgi:threonine dehydrogenase-like Zn-dependent dehydrogenase